MLRGGEAVLVAVSGGADSVALLDVLGALREALGLTLTVVHVHHGLRPEADAEADGVRALCERLGVACHVERVVVRRAPPWDGLEAESRRARHAALERMGREVGAARIATGHTADDQAETVLMRLLQGAGPRGLGGIAPMRGLLIRPLIETRRVAIEEYLGGRGLAWAEDPSNRDVRFLRNRIRHDLLPFIAKVSGASVVEALGRSAAAARAVVADLEERARADLARLATRDGAGLSLDVGALAERPIELAAEMLRQAAALLGETRPLRGPAQRAHRRLLGEAPPRRAARLGGLAVERSGRRLRVGPVALPALVTRAWAVPDALELPEIEARLTARVLAHGRAYVVPREPGRAAFDVDALPPALAVRARRRGDVFSPFGAPALRRLKSFLIDAGVPRWQRARTPLVEAGREIIWVAGIRRGSVAPVTAATTRVLELAIESHPRPE
ncbi:MAG TPA: tRNA lysidine(34) synthetase TilS [Candidatus Eisenbacteria bacterium]|nr:tRNA lysidine(34) synthetase TilS [Candidatus Eisenbacteria bacterium]